MMTHHSVMTSSLRVQKLHIDESGDFSMISILTIRQEYLEIALSTYN